MTHYEITFITSQEGDPGVSGAIQAAGGHIIGDRSLGRRQFAYPIAKETAGYYTTYRFDAEPSSIVELVRTIELMPEILRQLVVEVPTTQLVKATLEVEGLKEAKELEAAAPTELEAKPEETAEQKAERDRLLQEQLDKLLSGDQNTGKPTE